jgi:hypothetical protein
MPNLRGVFLLAASTLFSTGAASAKAQSMPSCTSAIQVLFDRYGTTQIPAGSTIWFTGVLKAVHTADGRALTSPIRIDVHQSRITFGKWPYVITMPDSTVVLDPSISVPYRLWSSPQQLNVAYSPSQVSKEALFDALPYKAPEPFIPRSSGPVTWTATFAASRPGIAIDWAWSAAVYSQFGPVGTFQLKPLSGRIAEVNPQAGPPDLYENADAAGTAEAYKQYVIAGAMGSGAPQYTGARSDTASVTACPSSLPLPPTPTQVTTPRAQGVVFLISPAGGASFGGAPSFASPVSQHIEFGDGSVGQAVDRCYATDLCALISYGNGDRLAIYSEGAAGCKPYVLYFNRTNAGREIYGFSRDLERDQSSGTPGARCPDTRTTRIVMVGGRVALTISKNTDGTLKFRFADALH